MRITDGSFLIYAKSFIIQKTNRAPMPAALAQYIVERCVITIIYEYPETGTFIE